MNHATNDAVLRGFLAAQCDDAVRLSAESDLVCVQPADAGVRLDADFRELVPPPLWAILAMTPEDDPPTRYFVSLRCRGMVHDAAGEPREHDRFLALLQFPPAYLRLFDPRVVSLLAPLNTWHPNVMGPAVCVGHQAPATGLVDLVYQLWEILTYQNFAADNPLNDEAAQWVRRHTARFPLDRRPIKRPRSSSPRTAAQVLGGAAKEAR